MLISPSIDEILEQDNLVVRNLQVTMGYYRLSQGMRKYISSKNVSWVGFATHASRTAGQALRHELMPKKLKSAIIRKAGFDNTYMFFTDALDKHNLETSEKGNNRITDALEKVSFLISEGNIIVFAELARPFENFLHEFSKDWQPDNQKFQTFLKDNLVPGPVEQDGQDLLYEAFEAYYQARFETNNKRKAEYIFQGNLLVGLHEQTRLQPQIAEALAVPFDIFIDESNPEKKQADNKNNSPSIPRKLIIKTITRMWMSFSLPNSELKLGQDVVAPTGIISFPSDLLIIEDSRCKSLVDQFDSINNTLTGSAADNWGTLSDRMSFVVDFFRSHQQNKHLFEQPFLDSQVSAIEAGHIPAGTL